MNRNFTVLSQSTRSEKEKKSVSNMVYYFYCLDEYSHYKITILQIFLRNHEKRSFQVCNIISLESFNTSVMFFLKYHRICSCHNNNRQEAGMWEEISQVETKGVLMEWIGCSENCWDARRTPVTGNQMQMLGA